MLEKVGLKTADTSQVPLSEAPTSKPRNEVLGTQLSQDAQSDSFQLDARGRPKSELMSRDMTAFVQAYASGTQMESVKDSQLDAMFRELDFLFRHQKLLNNFDLAELTRIFERKKEYVSKRSEGIFTFASTAKAQKEAQYARLDWYSDLASTLLDNRKVKFSPSPRYDAQYFMDLFPLQAIKDRASLKCMLWEFERWYSIKEQGLSKREQNKLKGYVLQAIKQAQGEGLEWTEGYCDRMIRFMAKHYMGTKFDNVDKTKLKLMFEDVNGILNNERELTNKELIILQDVLAQKRDAVKTKNIKTIVAERVKWYHNLIQSVLDARAKKKQVRSAQNVECLAEAHIDNNYQSKKDIENFLIDLDQLMRLKDNDLSASDIARLHDMLSYAISLHIHHVAKTKIDPKIDLLKHGADYLGNNSDELNIWGDVLNLGYTLTSWQTERPSFKDAFLHVLRREYHYKW